MNSTFLRRALRVGLVRVIGLVLLGGWLAGCQSPQATAFAPIQARLDRVDGGGQMYFVVVNTSGQTLHNYHLRAYLWYDEQLTYVGYLSSSLPQRQPAMTYSCVASGPEWKAGEVLHFQLNPASAEVRIVYPVSRVQIAGGCDEGNFREYWQVNKAGRLQSAGK